MKSEPNGKFSEAKCLSGLVPSELCETLSGFHPWEYGYHWIRSVRMNQLLDNIPKAESSVGRRQVAVRLAVRGDARSPIQVVG